MTHAVSLVLAISFLLVIGVLSSCMPLKEDTVTTISDPTETTTPTVASWSGTKQIGTSLSDQGNGIATDSNGNVYVTMSLTAPGCPVAGDMPGWIETAARTVEGVKDVEVQLTFDPPWDPSRMSDEARLALNML